MRKLNRLLMGILLPVGKGLSAQNAKASTLPQRPDPQRLYLFMLSCALLVRGRAAQCYFTNLSTTTHDKIPNLSVRMCDSMLTVKDGPGVYRGQFFCSPRPFHPVAALAHHTS
jgi:hypothetical protein